MLKPENFAFEYSIPALLSQFQFDVDRTSLTRNIFSNYTFFLALEGAFLLVEVEVKVLIKDPVDHALHVKWIELLILCNPNTHES